MYTFKIYHPVHKNVKPSLEPSVEPNRHATATYYRKTLNCDCAAPGGLVTQVFKDNQCKKITRTAIVNKKTVASGYNMDYNQYLKKKCATYQQRNTPTPNCCDSQCATNNVYKRSNVAFKENGAVSASLQTATKRWEAENMN